MTTIILKFSKIIISMSGPPPEFAVATLNSRVRNPPEQLVQFPLIRIIPPRSFFISQAVLLLAMSTSVSQLPILLATRPRCGSELDRQ
jgi:hypothetical protein